MGFISDPPILAKIHRMKQRVCWQHSEFQGQRIDQTRLALDNTDTSWNSFSFAILGDSGIGRHRGDNPQRRVAEWLMANSDRCKFVIHTGDLVYLVGAAEQYPDNFIKPYREWLVGGEVPDNLSYGNLVFKLPFLPVPGNHDYYNVPWFYGLLATVLAPIRHLIRHQIDLDYGHRGSQTGDVYARAFLDYLKGYDAHRLAAHVAKHYTAKSDSGRCLQYVSGRFTRLPNRYYTFQQAGVDFFALDSNTFNAPLPIPDTPKDKQFQQDLMRQRQHLLAQYHQLLGDRPVEPEQMSHEQYGQLEQLDEQLRDIEKQLDNLHSNVTVDREQLNWLKQRLIDSWQTPGVRGRVLYFHHPPYVTEATKWYQGQTLAVRYQLRQVLDAVKASIGHRCGDRPIVDLVISGHAHCFEHLQTRNTGHADSYTHFLVCGGSGFSLRRQRQDGTTLTETINGKERVVAESLQFLGREGHGSEKRRPYSALTVDVHPGVPLRLTVHPHVVEKYNHQWENRTASPIHITAEKPATSTPL
jgi:3',5'-cyclic AMP phosphodiesterase CpdA